jgi:hypothetical protein
MDIKSAITFLRDYGLPGGIGTAIGSFLTYWVKSYRGRIKEIEYHVEHFRLGLSLDDQVHGSIRVQWQNQELVNLFNSTVTVENTTSEDYKDLTLAVYSLETTFILSDRLEMKGSTFIPELKTDFINRLIPAPGEEMSEVQVWVSNHRREYTIKIFNRGSAAVFRYLTTVPNAGQPFLFVEVLEKGVTAKFKTSVDNTFGAPRRWALGVGIAVCLLVLVAVAYSPSWWGTAIAMLAGFMVLPIGGGLYVLGKTIKRIVLG